MGQATEQLAGKGRGLLEGTREQGGAVVERPGHEPALDRARHEPPIGASGDRTGKGPGEAGDGLERDGGERSGALKRRRGGDRALAGAVDEVGHGGERRGRIGAHGCARDGAERGRLLRVVDLRGSYSCGGGGGGRETAAAGVGPDVAEGVTETLIVEFRGDSRGDVAAAVARESAAAEAAGQPRVPVPHHKRDKEENSSRRKKKKKKKR